MTRSPLFGPISTIRPDLFQTFEHWPYIETLQAIHDQNPTNIENPKGQTLRLVAQDQQSFQDLSYLAYIHEQGIIPTRYANWHDFFQALSFAMFPKTKRTIVRRHYSAQQHRIQSSGVKSSRSNTENMLSLFDEGGVIVYSSNPLLLELVHGFQWKQLFWENRSKLESHFGCLVYGHAVYEKAIQPYIGMCANAILVPVDSSFFSLNLQQRISQLDQITSQMFLPHGAYQTTKDLSPFPILGMPGWWPGQDQSFYQNEQYFRPGRHRQLK